MRIYYKGYYENSSEFCETTNLVPEDDGYSTEHLGELLDRLGVPHAVEPKRIVIPKFYDAKSIKDMLKEGSRPEPRVLGQPARSTVLPEEFQLKQDQNYL